MFSKGDRVLVSGLTYYKDLNSNTGAVIFSNEVHSCVKLDNVVSGEQCFYNIHLTLLRVEENPSDASTI